MITNDRHIRFNLAGCLQQGAPLGDLPVTDFMRAVADQITPWVPRRYLPLGTDGFGRSDSRAALRSFFEIDAPHIVVAMLSSLAAEGRIGPDMVQRAIHDLGIDPDVGAPWTR